MTATVPAVLRAEVVLAPMTAVVDDSHTAAMHRRSLTRLVVVVLGLLVVVGVGSSAASAQAGVGIDPGELSGFTPLAPGDTLSVNVRVRNPGQSPASYQLSVQSVTGVPELALDGAWVRFEPARFELGAQETRNVAVTVVLPRNAAAGNYLGLLTAQIVSSTNDQGGARVLAGVATKLRFSVVPPPETSSGGLGVPAIFGGIAAVVVVGGAGMFLLRRSAMRLL